MGEPFTAPGAYDQLFESFSAHEDALPLGEVPFDDILTSSDPAISNEAYPDVKPEDIIIAVMGVTGSGKTTFISHFAPEAKVGHNLVSCTSDIGCFQTKVGSRDVYLVDTPGFDDTHISDSDVLRKLANWLDKAFQKDIKLSGIIYLHRISDNRVGGSAMKNLRVFRELCGEEAMSGVVLATTMWEGVSADKGVSREDELKDKFWAGMIRKGSRVMRQDQGATSARAILESIMERRQRMPLALQAEMAANVDFNETGAGRALQADMATQMRRFQAEIRELQQQLAEARQGGDIDTWKELAKARAEDVAELRRLNEDYQKLNVTAQELRDQELAREREAHSRELAHLAKVHELDLRLQAERESGRNPISHTVRWFFRLFK